MDMRRRDLIAALGGAAVSPQPADLRRRPAGSGKQDHFQAVPGYGGQVGAAEGVQLRSLSFG